MRFVICLLAILFAAQGSRAETALEYECLGNHFETCFVVIDGQIEPGLTDRLRREFPEGIEGRRLYLNSPGGNLGEALKLGRYIRSTGLITLIGAKRAERFNEDGSKKFLEGDFPKAGICESACVYAFIGGQERYLADGQTLGLHQFRAEKGEINSQSAQVIAGDLVSYMVEMGVDARIFKLASGTGSDDMYRLTHDQALQYDLITPRGYEPFFMEPYRNGVIASSRRASPTNGYDLANQITFLCRNNEPFALIRAVGVNTNLASEATTATISMDGRNYPGTARVEARSTGDWDYITLSLTRSMADDLIGADEVYLAAEYSRASGAARRVSLDLSDMDRAMIKSAFTLCIE
ncbi:hypothetical protein [Antarctobacter jejuensis]|uniref:hypothetical protein n=1 Tax=Antarctobacter jejuensis TaxID=1439938 RepID=UPI003FD5AA5C